MAARSGVAQAERIARAPASPSSAVASSASAVVPAGSPACAISRPSAVPELVVSTQPRLPQAHGAPRVSTTTWPNCPAKDRPRKGTPALATAPPIPVPMVNITTSRQP
jgi:hypothetical protein